MAINDEKAGHCMGVRYTVDSDKSSLKRDNFACFYAGEIHYFGEILEVHNSAGFGEKCVKRV